MIGADGAIGTTIAAAGGGWQSPVAVTQPRAAATSSDLALAEGQGQLDLVWEGDDQALGWTWLNVGLNGGRWHDARPITPPGAAAVGTALAVLRRSETRVDAFFLGIDRAVAWTWVAVGVNGGNWNQPVPITPAGAARAGSPLVAISRSPDTVEVLYIGAIDGAVAVVWLDGAGNWQRPGPITPSFATRDGSPLAAASRSAKSLDVFFIGPDGALASTWSNTDVQAGKWQPPFPITPKGAARLDSPLCAVARSAIQLDVFYIGPDDAVASSGVGPNEGWPLPFPITPRAAAGPRSALAVSTRTPDQLDVFYVGSDSALATTWWNGSLRAYVIVPIYWGQNWLSGKPFSIAEMQRAIETLCRGHFVEGLAEYGVGDMRVLPVSGIANSDVPDSARVANPGFDNDRLTAVIAREIDEGRAPAPTSLPRGEIPFYMVLPEQGCFYGPVSGWAGGHFSFVYRGTGCLYCFVYQGADVLGTTPVIGHEFAEATSGSEIGDSCYWPSPNGDISMNEIVDGVMVQAYLSLARGMCIIPGSQFSAKPKP